MFSSSSQEINQIARPKAQRLTTLAEERLTMLANVKIAADIHATVKDDSTDIAMLPSCRSNSTRAVVRGSSQGTTVNIFSRFKTIRLLLPYTIFAYSGSGLLPLSTVWYIAEAGCFW